MAGRPPYPGAPRWVKVSGIVVIVLVLSVLFMLITGIGGSHGPGRHMQSGDESGLPSSSITEHAQSGAGDGTATPPAGRDQ